MAHDPSSSLRDFLSEIKLGDIDRNKFIDTVLSLITEYFQVSYQITKSAIHASEDGNDDHYLKDMRFEYNHYATNTLKQKNKKLFSRVSTFLFQLARPIYPDNIPDYVLMVACCDLLHDIKGFLLRKSLNIKDYAYLVKQLEEAIHQKRSMIHNLAMDTSIPFLAKALVSKHPDSKFSDYLSDIEGIGKHVLGFLETGPIFRLYKIQDINSSNINEIKFLYKTPSWVPDPFELKSENEDSKVLMFEGKLNIDYKEYAYNVLICLVFIPSNNKFRITDEYFFIFSHEYEYMMYIVRKDEDVFNFYYTNEELKSIRPYLRPYLARVLDTKFGEPSELIHRFLVALYYKKKRPTLLTGRKDIFSSHAKPETSSSRFSKNRLFEPLVLRKTEDYLG